MNNPALTSSLKFKKEMVLMKLSSTSGLLACTVTLTVIITFFRLIFFDATTLTWRSRPVLVSYMLKNESSANTITSVSAAITKTPLKWREQFFKQSKSALVAGKVVEPNSKFLVIGIATVYREENYLGRTLSSLIQESDEEERKDVSVVIYLADNPKKNSRQLTFIKKNYQEYLDSGFFQVIASCPAIYPPMDFVETKRTYNNSKDRVLWRAKQVVDFAFLFTYSQALAPYYLVLEDDLLAAPQYVTAIRDFTERKQGRWVALEFTTFLCIGLLFHTEDLPNLTQMLLIFYQNQPVDFLLRKFIDLEVPEANMNVRRNPSIFQHIGMQSTLPNKIQMSVDETFATATRKYASNRNPKARVVTTMQVHNDFVPDYAYKSTPGYFWGTSKPDDTFDIIFPKPLNISRVVIFSGICNDTLLLDSITDGFLQVSDKLVMMSSNNNSALCDSFKEIALFQNGIIDYNVQRSTPSNAVNGTLTNGNDDRLKVQCIRVQIGPSQKSRVILRKIQIFKSET